MPCAIVLARNRVPHKLCVCVTRLVPRAGAVRGVKEPSKKPFHFFADNGCWSVHMFYTRLAL